MRAEVLCCTSRRPRRVGRAAAPGLLRAVPWYWVTAWEIREGGGASHRAEGPAVHQMGLVRAVGTSAPTKGLMSCCDLFDSTPPPGGPSPFPVTTKHPQKHSFPPGPLFLPPCFLLKVLLSLPSCCLLPSPPSTTHLQGQSGQLPRQIVLQTRGSPVSNTGSPRYTRSS